jgi:hypothetical protein
MSERVPHRKNVDADAVEGYNQIELDDVARVIFIDDCPLLLAELSDTKKAMNNNMTS